MAVNDSHIPLGLTQLGPSQLGIRWDDGHESIYNVRNLRLACRCAHCVDEWTHEKRIQEELIPVDVRPRRIDSRHRVWRSKLNSRRQASA